MTLRLSLITGLTLIGACAASTESNAAAPMPAANSEPARTCNLFGHYDCRGCASWA